MAEVSICSRSSCSELTPEEERIMIRDIALTAETKSKEGDTFYLITQRFFLCPNPLLSFTPGKYYSLHFLRTRQFIPSNFSVSVYFVFSLLKMKKKKKNQKK